MHTFWKPPTCICNLLGNKPLTIEIQPTQTELVLSRAHTPHMLHASSCTSKCYVQLMIFTYTLSLDCTIAHKQKAHDRPVVDRRGQQKTQYLWHSWALPNGSKHNEGSCLSISTISLRLRVAECCYLVIFVMTTTDNRQNQLHYSLHMCAG